jgi:hypothetical protein
MIMARHCYNGLFRDCKNQFLILQIVGLGSNLCSFCILDVRPSQGYTTLYSWRSEVGLELLDMQFCRKTKEWWTLEKKLGESQNLMLVRYSDRPRKGERVAALISSNEAVLR